MSRKCRRGDVRVGEFDEFHYLLTSISNLVLNRWYANITQVHLSISIKSYLTEIGRVNSPYIWEHKFLIHYTILLTANVVLVLIRMKGLVSLLAAQKVSFVGEIEFVSTSSVAVDCGRKIHVSLVTERFW